MAQILGNLGDRRAIVPLIDVLKDNYCTNWNYTAKVEAARSLGKLKDERAILPLIRALQDSQSEVRQMAVWALGEIQDTRAAKPLIDVLQDSGSQVRIAARKAVVKLVSKFPHFDEIIPF